MEGKTFREIVLGAALFGFVGGWVGGLFLGLWAYVTLGVR